jgi:hypothetical protein
VIDIAGSLFRPAFLTSSIVNSLEVFGMGCTSRFFTPKGSDIRGYRPGTWVTL